MTAACPALPAQCFLSGLDAEIGRVVHTPKDFEDRFATPKGCYFHVDMTPLRLGVNRPAAELGGYATPIPGLSLAGAGSHPGGTVNGWCGRCGPLLIVGRAAHPAGIGLPAVPGVRAAVRRLAERDRRVVRGRSATVRILDGMAWPPLPGITTSPVCRCHRSREKRPKNGLPTFCHTSYSYF